MIGMRSGVLALGAVVFVGCCPKLPALAPKVKLFRVAPEAYCPSTTRLRVVWDAVGGTTRLGERGQILGKVADTGATTVQARSTTYMLEVRRGVRHDAAIVKVNPLAAFRSRLEQKVDTCDAGEPAYMRMQGVKTYRDDEIDPLASVLRIANPCVSTDATQPCPTIVVRRVLPDKGRDRFQRTQSWRLAAGQSVALQPGHVGMAGTWVLLRELLPDERCPYDLDDGQPAGPPTGPPPTSTPASLRNLVIDLELACGGSS